jgi:phosphopantetheinyl transferase
VALRRVRPGDAALAGLHPRERGLVAASATPKRRAEFAAGRCAARAALARLLGAAAHGAAVLRPPSGGGRPVAVHAGGEPLPAHVSISHAAGIAAAAAAPAAVGIDVVALEPLDRAFCEEAFPAGELSAWERWLGARGLHAPCLAFAAKEAAVKWLGTGLTVPLHGVRVTPAGRRKAARLGGLDALAVELRIATGGRSFHVPGWVAASARRVLVVAGGAPWAPTQAGWP